MMAQCKVEPQDEPPVKRLRDAGGARCKVEPQDEPPVGPGGAEEPGQAEVRPLTDEELLHGYTEDDPRLWDALANIFDADSCAGFDNRYGAGF